ncbi:MAG: hypothetical protein WCA04_14130 [Geobacteraceae bacterium]
MQKIVPAIQQLKLDFWGHDQVILHEHDIREEKDHFALLRTSRALRELFMERLDEIIKLAPMQIITAVIVGLVPLCPQDNYSFLSNQA